MDGLWPPLVWRVLIIRCREDTGAGNMGGSRTALCRPVFHFLAAACFLVICSPTKFVQCQNENVDTVMLKPHTSIKYFHVPTSDEPVMSWMDVQRGLFPNTSRIMSSLKVGEPLTVFVYLKDDSNLYDIKVSDCWAYDDDIIANSKYKLHLTNDKTDEQIVKKTSLMKEWRKYKFPKGSNMKSFLYTDLRAFKFPDKEQIHIMCDVELCFKTCETKAKQADSD